MSDFFRVLLADGFVIGVLSGIAGFLALMIFALAWVHRPLRRYRDPAEDSRRDIDLTRLR